METKVRESCRRLALYYEELTLLSLISLFSRVDDDDDDDPYTQVYMRTTLFLDTKKKPGGAGAKLK